MNVLIACEESQVVCTEFRERGFNSFSCDIQDCSGGHPEWHIMGDAVNILNPVDYGKFIGICFSTMDDKIYAIDKWDLIIAHPPCTFLTVTGNKWFKPEFKDRFPGREKQREEAVNFFMKFVRANCKHIAIENPVGIMSTRYRKPNQYIQPFYFGDEEQKKTGLWLKNLPELKPTNMVKPQLVYCVSSDKYEPRWHMETMHLPPDERTKARSKTFRGIARAMAAQWGDYILKEDKK